MPPARGYAMDNVSDGYHPGMLETECVFRINHYIYTHTHVCAHVRNEMSSISFASRVTAATVGYERLLQ